MTLKACDIHIKKCVAFELIMNDLFHIQKFKIRLFLPRQGDGGGWMGGWGHIKSLWNTATG